MRKRTVVVNDKTAGRFSYPMPMGMACSTSTMMARKISTCIATHTRSMAGNRFGGKTRSGQLRRYLAVQSARHAKRHSSSQAGNSPGFRFAGKYTVSFSYAQSDLTMRGRF